MKIIVLGGFLGSGKTTVLLQFARYLIARSAGKTEIPVVILENEISEAGVDNQLLTQNDFTVENIFSGCICCTSSAQMDDAIRQIEAQYHPEWLLIEATGMASPDLVRKGIREGLNENAAILALADAKRWNRVVKAMPAFVESQMCEADVILVNKIDLVDEDVLREVCSQAAAYQPSALLCPVCALEPQGDDFWEKTAAALERGLKEGQA
ncbi:MAG: cobalamin biosynthesis protein P47K [Lachnospiraceae bacterium]|nr:cobalamin biosynthesis protein P47K [Lachnospiraceae bacterium]MBQ1399590.1 cobalamin biosynthesis protein P47K [Lachnospiraceae bacterium]MBQ3399844.1 cobalamin biosynthesis protein P47K [Lachnospiraceae bacterium]MBQ9464942.1 cobalamin biosynthesis protein P47K [Lachnospiraceae bacterium]MBR0106605.1 cobalamin biosynthesis protein P47K [Lachnospiraceae bacterium]